jgi:hypothetical protein
LGWTSVQLIRAVSFIAIPSLAKAGLFPVNELIVDHGLVRCQGDENVSAFDSRIILSVGCAVAFEFVFCRLNWYRVRSLPQCLAVITPTDSRFSFGAFRGTFVFRLESCCFVASLAK